MSSREISEYYVRRMLWDAEVQRLIHAGMAAVDRGRAREVLTYLADDFVLFNDKSRIDRQTFAALLAQREEADYVTRHVVSNLITTHDAADRINAHFVVTVHRQNAAGADHSIQVADWADTWSIAGDEPVLQVRVITPMRNGPQTAGVSAPFHVDGGSGTEVATERS